MDIQLVFRLEDQQTIHSSLPPRRQEPPGAKVYPPQLSEDNTDEAKWWQPLPATIWFRITVFVSTLTVIVALEVLFQRSKKNRGLADAIVDGFQYYTWTYIPSSVMALIGLTFATADSTARTLHPFQVLRRGNAAFKEMLYDPACQLSLVAVIRAARTRQFALAATICTALMAPALTIVTSGLYTPTTVSWTNDIALDVTGWFNIEDKEVRVVSLGGDYDFLSLIQFTNMSYPPSTYCEYAFSTLGAAELHGHNGNDSSLTLNVRLPAVRVKMNCSLTNYWEQLNNSNQQIIVDPPPGCHSPHALYHNDTSRKDRQLKFELSYQISLSESDYILADITEDAMNQIVTDEDQIPGEICSDHRSHFWFLAGHQDNKSYDSLTLLHCNPYIEALYVTANFSLPAAKVLGSPPQILPASDSGVFLSAAPNATARPWNNVSQFLSMLVNGTGGMPLADGFVGRHNIDKFRARLEHVYAIYIAQVLHTYYRRSTDDDVGSWAGQGAAATAHFAADPVNGTVIDGARLRLVQNGISTRILEALLAIVLACGAVACILEGKTRILPKDPGSIAAKMSLFADGEVWRAREVVEELGDGEVGEKRRDELLEGWVFRMGWWDGREEREFEGDGRAGNKRFGVDATRLSVRHGSASV